MSCNHVIRGTPMKIRAKGKCRGQALIEFTLMLPIILIIVGGLTDLGLAFYFAIATQNAVREGARIAAGTSGLTANDPTIQNAVVSRIVPSSGLYTITNADVNNTAPPVSAADCARNVTVSATGTYQYLFLHLIGFTTTPITRSATMRYEPGTELCLTLACTCS